jgi:hypothetical protein
MEELGGIERRYTPPCGGSWRGEGAASGGTRSDLSTAMVIKHPEGR